MKWSKVNQGDRRWHGKGERKLNEADQGQEFSTVKGFSLIFQPGYAIHTLPMINSSRMSYCVWTRRCLNRIWLTMGGRGEEVTFAISGLISRPDEKFANSAIFFPLYLLSPLSRHGCGSMFPPLADGSQQVSILQFFRVHAERIRYRSGQMWPSFYRYYILYR